MIAWKFQRPIKEKEITAAQAVISFLRLF